MRLSKQFVTKTIEKLESFCCNTQSGSFNIGTPWLTMVDFPLLEFKLARKLNDQLLMIRRKGQKYEYPHISFYYSSPPEVFGVSGMKVINGAHYSIYIDNECCRLNFDLDYCESIIQMLHGVANVNYEDCKAFSESFLTDERKILEVLYNIPSDVKAPLFKNSYSYGVAVNRGGSRYVELLMFGVCVDVIDTLLFLSFGTRDEDNWLMSVISNFVNYSYLDDIRLLSLGKPLNTANISRESIFRDRDFGIEQFFQLSNKLNLSNLSSSETQHPEQGDYILMKLVVGENGCERSFFRTNLSEGGYKHQISPQDLSTKVNQ